MAKWTFADGTTLETGGRILGDSDFAEDLREQVRQKAGVHALPVPMPTVPLDVRSDYLLDLFARQRAVRVRTDYERTIDDAPASLRERLEELRRAAEVEPYGTVH